MINQFANMVLPVVMSICAVCFIKSKDSVKAFTSGAVDGMRCCAELLPSIILIMCSINALFASGLCDVLCNMFSPVLRAVKVPDAMIPAVILRPFSGSGVTALADKLFESEGADSAVAKTACLLMGSTDTVLYTLGMYMGAAKIKKTRYALPASLIVFAFSVVFCSFMGDALFN